MGIEVAKEVGADPSAFVAVVDALSAALEPVFESSDEEEQALSNTERQLEVCGGLLQNTEWRVSLEDYKFPASSSPRKSAYESCCSILKGLYATSRSSFVDGISLKTDSKSIDITIGHVVDEIKADNKRKKVELDSN